MIVGIHQPNYLPYMGYFNKMKNVDIFILYDIAQYVKNRYDNRNRIRIREGAVYLTIPVTDKDSYLKRFNEVVLPSDSTWQKNHWKSIHANYANSEFFNLYSEFFQHIYSKKFTFLSDFNEMIILYIKEKLDLDSEIIKTTKLNLNLNLKSTDLLIDILKKVDAKEYLSGPSGRKYLDEKKFHEAKIKLKFQDYQCPVYKQRYPGFIPNLSVIDLIFNMGEKSKLYI
jgi:hypothetical protein